MAFGSFLTPISEILSRLSGTSAHLSLSSILISIDFLFSSVSIDQHINFGLKESHFSNFSAKLRFVESSLLFSISGFSSSVNFVVLLGQINESRIAGSSRAKLFLKNAKFICLIKIYLSCYSCCSC